MALWILLSLLSAAIVVKAATEPVVYGSLFFHTRQHEILDDALSSGVFLTKEHVSKHCGLKSEEMQVMHDVVRKLGGHVDRVSQLGDWMHVQFPKSLGERKPPTDVFPCKFLHSSLRTMEDQGLRNIAHHVSSALQQAGLNELASQLMLTAASESTDSVLSHEAPPSTVFVSESEGKNILGRQLQQAADGKQSENRSGLYTLQEKGCWPLFVANKSEAVKNIGAWLLGYAVMVLCQGEQGAAFEGESTPACLLNYTVVLQPTQIGSSQLSAKTLTINFPDLKEYRRRCDEIPDVCDLFGDAPLPVRNDTYVYAFPLYRYALPNAQYSAHQLATVADASGNTEMLSMELSIGIYNYQNVSAVSLRQYYGVDSNLQGSNDTIQATTLMIGIANAAVNITALDEYLNLLGLDPHSELLISDFGVPNNVSVCIGNPNCVETMLDVETLQSFAPNATTFFNPNRAGKTNKGTVQEVLTFLDNLLTADPVASVASISWSVQYSSFSIPTLEDYMKKLAAMGVSILVASGDSGASGDSSKCYPAVSELNGPLVGNIPLESWPAVSPWVTAVGATQFLNVDGKTVETVCQSNTYGGITSGGGFSGTSMNFTTPSWQQPAVSTYLRENNASTFSGFPTESTPGWNPQGRGFPDIAVYGGNFPILEFDGSLDFVSGTSLSAPMAAALFTLTNQKLMSMGYRKIGYANPMLYWMAENCPTALNDITVGDNQNGESGSPCLFGFPAARGWDPVTGLGSINFEPFVDCAMKYQDATFKSDLMASESQYSGCHWSFILASLMIVLEMVA